MTKKQIFQQIKGKLIVSCQALENEPLHGSEVMAKMAKAAYIGGASGIRANGLEDIKAIKQAVALPIIGLVKRDYPDSEVYITATKKEVDELIEAGVDIIALDATNRTRPNSETLETLVAYIKANNILVMADISTFEEGKCAAELGVDCVSTTMSGYTAYSPQKQEPDFYLLKKLVKELSIPVFAEGRISTPEEAKRALDLGAFSVVVGSAITRPQEITKNFAKVFEKEVAGYDGSTNGVKEQVRRIN
ncbi:N-acetylmannosamine-6-phosphate 2-epimerase [Sutcliffiella horikoshii]|uniref:N-acetylmannosamine-6-phosphate 2-epimerase n=1 Tax=Sutcliffiella horikoshii TaxID=79883 RepID=UPI003CEC6B42